MNIIKEAQLNALAELKEELNLTSTPKVPQLLNYLREKSEFHLVGKMSTSTSVNKEALRLAALLLEEAYVDDV